MGQDYLTGTEAGNTKEMDMKALDLTAAAKASAKTPFTGTAPANIERMIAETKAESAEAAPRRTITVGIYLSVEIDLDALNDEYGTAYTAAEAREDVKASAFNAVAQTMYPQEALDRIVVGVTQKS